MEQIQNVGQVSFQANTMPAKEAEQVPVQAISNPIENGDEKSMDALKWAGIIGAGAALAGAITVAVIKGKPIPEDCIKYLDDGTAVLNDKGKEAYGFVKKFIKGFKTDGNDIKITGTVNKKVNDTTEMVAKFKRGIVNEVSQATKEGDKTSSVIETFVKKNGSINAETVTLGDKTIKSGEEGFDVALGEAGNLWEEFRAVKQKTLTEPSQFDIDEYLENLADNITDWDSRQ